MSDAEPRGRMGFRALWFVVLVLVAGPGAARAGAPTLEEAASLIGLPAAAIPRVLAGEVVATAVEASSDKDLSLAVAVRLDAPLDEVYAFVQTDALAATQTVTLASGRIDPSDPGASLAELKLAPMTLKALAQDAGGTFQLSESEARRLGHAGEQGVLASYRALLAERAQAYWSKGLPGVQPYAGNNRSPAEDLRAAMGATAMLSKVPALAAELARPPVENTGVGEHQLFWALQKGRDQAAPVLFHRVLYRDDDGEVFFERRFYSAYDYDALQIAAGVLPLAQGGSVLFYVNRTFTAQVTGFGGSAKRSIGRQLLESELVAELERIRDAVAKR